MLRSLLGPTVKLSLLLATLALIQSLGDSHASAETLPEIRDHFAVSLAQKDPRLKESLFPVDDAIRTNQVGMQPNQAKLVVFAGQLSGAPQFQIADERGRSVFTGQLEHFGLDSDSGEELWRGNFTAFRLKGTYRVGVSGRGFSHPFEIASGINNKLVRLASRWLYLQRSGIDLAIRLPASPIEQIIGLPLSCGTREGYILTIESIPVVAGGMLVTMAVMFPRPRALSSCCYTLIISIHSFSRMDHCKFLKVVMACLTYWMRCAGSWSGC